MRKLRLERVFASLDEDFQTGSYTEELDDINNILLDNSFCLQESVTQWNEQDEGRVTRADDSEDDAERDEDGDDINSGQIVFREQPAASKQNKMPQMGKPCGPMCRKKCMKKLQRVKGNGHLQHIGICPTVRKRALFSIWFHSARLCATPQVILADEPGHSFTICMTTWASNRKSVKHHF